MSKEPAAGTSAQGAALFRAAEVMSIAGRAASRRVLLQEAVTRSADTGAARPWHERAAARKDRAYIRDLCLALTQDGFGADLPTWLALAPQEADQDLRYGAKELRARLEKLKVGRQSDRSGPLCYVLHMSLPDNGSGYSVRSHHLIAAMRKNGLNPYCVTRLGFPGDTGQPGDVAVQSVDGIDYHRILQPGKRDFRNMRYVTDAAIALVEKLAPQQPYAIMAASNHENAAPALLAARYMGVPFIYDMRGFWELSTLAADPERAKTPQFATAVEMEAEIARQADLVFTLTEAMKGELRRRQVGNPNIHILPNAADPEVFRAAPRNAALARKAGIAEDTTVIGYVGSFTGYEGLDDLTRACVLLHQQGYDFRLLLIGSEPAHLKDAICPELQQIAVAGGITDKLIMPGRVPVQEVKDWYSLIDIVPIPRKDMAVAELVSPLKPLEAMAMEKAVVVTDLAALKEIVTHDETGIVVPRSDVAALAAALGRLIEDPAARASLGKRARQRIIDARNWDAVVRNFRDIIRQNLPG